MRFLALLLCLLSFFSGKTQSGDRGVLSGSLLDDRRKALEGATMVLISLEDSRNLKTIATEKDGSFLFQNIPFGYHRLKISYAGFQSLTIDSIFFRKERFDFNLNELTLKANGTLNEVVVFAEKPLVVSKGGNITFNSGELVLNAGTSVSDLLANVPLVAKDPNGGVTVRGREPKILIDDKPVELNPQQLQDLLESMPGSSIEKIEVLTNPPAQYANEPGGVINIVTKKNKAGRSGSITVYSGSRGEAGANGNYMYRKNKLAATLIAGGVLSRYEGEGYSIRKNIYKDSANFFNNTSNSVNKNIRPNFRANVDYEINKRHALNLVVQYNQNSYDNLSTTEYRNINRYGDTYKMNTRDVSGTGDTYNPDLSLNYTFQGKKAGEVLKLYTNANFSGNESNRRFYQKFLFPDYRLISDTVQQQINGNENNGYNLRLNYDLPLNKKTSISLGSNYIASNSDVEVNVASKRKVAETMVDIDSLSNNFLFHQYITNLRGSVKQMLGKDFSATGGLAAEATRISFDLLKAGSDTSNGYWSWLPFFNLNKSWKAGWNATASYRRTIRRPGINELNPTKDYSDPYNIRFGNPGLTPSLTNDFDVVVGRTKKAFNTNLSLGFNLVEDIFSQIRTKLSDSRTQMTWQNITSRKEYEVSTWSGYTINNKIKLNLSASYTYNQYSDFDKVNRKYRDGGSLTSNLNTNYTLKDLYSATGSFTFNRFANPQGNVNSTVSMNLGVQAKMLKKQMTVALNVIDPFSQQENRTFTYGTNYELENFNTTRTRNIRLSITYNLVKPPVNRQNGKQINKQQLQKMIKG